MILVGLTLLGVIFFFAAQILSKLQGGGEQAMERAQQAQAERIAPVGTVATGAQEAAPQAEAPAGGGQSGQELYQTACAACHDAGVAGAPKLGDQQAWTPRLEQGMEGLLQSVVNGKGAMPPGGGSQAGEQELRAAVEYMLQETGVEVPGGGGQAAAASAPAAETAGGAGGEVDLARGQEVVKQSCAACHTAGVAGAPKIGDQQAWQQRADKGMDTMLQNVIQGMGAMPPRGGGQFSDAELQAAIQVMLNDSGL